MDTSEVKVVMFFCGRFVFSQFHKVFLQQNRTGKVQLTGASFQLFQFMDYRLSFICLCSPKHSIEIITALTNTFTAILKIKIPPSLCMLL